MEIEEQLLALTADIVASYVGNNSIATSELPTAIKGVFLALGSLGQQLPEPAPEKPKGAVSIRASIHPDYLVSMIDGRQFKTLRRHLSTNGYTPETYREAFGLPSDYPMVAASYAEKRSALAIKLGLGRKAGQKPAKKARGKLSVRI